MASVRFICGTQDLHKKLEADISRFLGTEDTILYSSCFDANGGLFETLLGEEDAIISDALNHASIIDGVRLCKAKRFRYANNDHGGPRSEVEGGRCRRRALQADRDRRRLFHGRHHRQSEGHHRSCRALSAPMVMVDDSHAVGFVGENGRGSAEHNGVQAKIDLFTGTFGKALGGASGGYIAGRRPVIDLLRQRSRPYLFSNSLDAGHRRGDQRLPCTDRQQRRRRSAQRSLPRTASTSAARMSKLGFNLVPGEHPIIPVMLGDAKLAGTMADALLKEGIYVIGFSYPVVPKGQARIRTQMSAAHSPRRYRPRHRRLCQGRQRARGDLRKLSS